MVLVVVRLLPMWSLDAGLFSPIPTRSVLASKNSRFASVSPSKRASRSAPASLKTNVPPLRLTLPVAVKALVASVDPSNVRLADEPMALVDEE